MAIRGHRIRKARRARGWTQKDLAKRAGVTQAQISHLESGERGASLDVLKHLMKALGITDMREVYR